MLQAPQYAAAPTTLAGIRTLLIGPWTESCSLPLILAASGADILTTSIIRSLGHEVEIDVVVMDAGLKDSWGRPWISDLRASATGAEACVPVIGLYREPVPPALVHDFDVLLPATTPILDLVRAIAHLFGRRFS